MSITTRLDAPRVLESRSRRIVFRGLRNQDGGFDDATGMWAGQDDEAGRDESGIVHDADFVFDSSIIMVNDTAIRAALADRNRKSFKAASL